MQWILAFLFALINVIWIFSFYSHIILTYFRDPQFKEMLDLLAMLKKGYCDGMKVRIGRLQNLISSSCIGKESCGGIWCFISWTEIFLMIICNFRLCRTFGLHEHSGYIWDDISAVSPNGTWIHWLSESYRCPQSIAIYWRSQDIPSMCNIVLWLFQSAKTGCC